MGLREAIAAEPFDLFEQMPREILVVAAFDHAASEFLFKGQQFAVLTPIGNGAAQLICLTTGKPRRHHGQFDHLFLEDGHAQGPFKHIPNSVVGIGYCFQTLLAP